jgi:hypothetical protein
MTRLLSDCIRAGAPLVDGLAATPYNDPLGVALVGSMRPAELETFWVFLRSASRDTQCQYIQRSLYRTWPHLGASVRTWPKLAEELERDRLLPRLRINQPVYRQEIHRSLFKAVTDMHDAGAGLQQVSDYLGSHGL